MDVVILVLNFIHVVIKLYFCKLQRIGIDICFKTKTNFEIA